MTKLFIYWILFSQLVLCSMGADRYVWTNAPSSSPPYETWATAALTIQDAASVATAGEVVWITNGVYTGAGSEVVLVTNAIILRGMGDGTSIVDGEDVSSRRGIHVTTTAAGAVVEGVTITGGKVGYGVPGAGIYMQSDATITNCTIAGNTSSGRGTGIYLSAGLVTQCTVSNNFGNEWGGAWGGGAYMTGGKIMKTRILDNTLYGHPSGGGGGVYMTGGVLENCIIAKNRSTCAVSGNGGELRSGKGGGVRMTGGAIVNCTIVDNWAVGNGGGLYMTAGAVTNSIIYSNDMVSQGYGMYRNVYKSGGTFSDSCTIPLIAGTGNTDQDPGFVDWQNGDYHLMPGSAALDSGANGATGMDLDGNTRPVDGDGDGSSQCDMGAYEEGVPASRQFLCSFSAPVLESIATLKVVLTAAAVGPNTNITWYGWDFGDGNTINGAGLAVVTNTYSPGWYDVSLLVTNGASASTGITHSAFIKVAPLTNYVATGGSHTAPYDTIGKAASNVQAAVDVAYSSGGTGTVVLVASGTYPVSSYIVVENGITIKSESGPAVTTLKTGTQNRYFNLCHSNATVDGFTIVGINWSNYRYPGGAVFMVDGLVTNCVFTNNYVGGPGGAIFLVGGTVSDSLFVSNRVSEWSYGFGGAICQWGGLVDRCTFSYCWSQSKQGGGAVRMFGGTLRNSLAIGCSATQTDPSRLGIGGAVRMTGGAIENCTLVGGWAVSYGGGLHMSAGTVTNTIVYNNTSQQTTDHNVYKSGGTFQYSCSTPLVSDTGNIDTDPDFVDAANDDYHLQLNSSCANLGTNQGWMTGGVDLDGTNRIIDGIVDMGCFESASLSVGPLNCNFSAPVVEAFTNLEVVFSAAVFGAFTNINWYWWDFGDATTLDGASLSVVTNVYTPGYYAITLTVSNDNSEVTNTVKTAFIRIIPDIVYVATNGSDTAPYASWGFAASNLSDAIDVAWDSGGNKSRVLVGKGTYDAASQINLVKNITVEGVDGASETIIDGGDGARGSFSVLYVNASNAVLTGFTISGGYRNGVYDNGGGMQLKSGTVTNCIFTSNYCRGNGGGVHVTGGVLINSTVYDNYVLEWQYGYGGGIYLSGGVVQNCVITNNWTQSHRGGGGIYMTGGMVRNCVIADNRATRPNAGSEGDGGGILVTGGSVENCTVVMNDAVKDGGGIKVEGSTSGITNCIVYFNTANTGAQDIDNPVRVYYSCSPDLVAGTNGNIIADPVFADTNKQDFMIRSTSPCIKAGVNHPWMLAATDLAGNERIIGVVVDMGAYERIHFPGTVITIR